MKLTLSWIGLVLSITCLVPFSSWSDPACVSLLSQPRTYRDLKTLDQLRIMTLNLENLFENMSPRDRADKTRFQTEFKGYTPGKIKQKNLTDLQKLGATIQRENPDVLVVEEVETFTALKDFSAEFLNQNYDPVLIQGNDRRGFNIGFLIKKDLPVHVKVESHKYDQWFDPILNQTTRLFSRDVPIVKFYVGTSTQVEKEEPFMIVLGNHAKSQIDRGNGQDPRSSVLRRAQYKAMGEIGAALEAKHPGVPIFLAGDFNTSIYIGNKELEPLLSVFQDSFNLIPGSLPFEERITHSFHPTGYGAHYSQLDAIMANRSAQPYLQSVSIVNYLDETGSPMPLPISIKERRKQPSDHRGIILKLKVSPTFFGLPPF